MEKDSSKVTVDSSHPPSSPSLLPRRRGKISWRRARIGLLIVVLGLLAIGIGVVTWTLRARLHQQIASREAAIIYQLALFQVLSESPGNGQPQEPGVVQELTLMYRAEKLGEFLSRLQNVWGGRIYDSKGNLILAVPVFLEEYPLAPELFPMARNGRPASRFFPSVSSTNLFLLPQEAGLDLSDTIPIHDVVIPLTSQDRKQIVGILELLLDGHPLQQEFRRLDQTLFLEALGVWGVAGGLSCIVLLWIFGRLERAYRELQDRTQRLIQANAELSFLNSTAAVGAVASSLLHDLKNPLTGLLFWLEEKARQESKDGEQAVYEQALHQTRRMHQLVQEISRVLRESQSEKMRYELEVEELQELLQRRLQPLGQEQGVTVSLHLEGQGTLDNRQVNLLLLILDQLVRNAVEATPKGKTVRVSGRSETDRWVFEVHDQGSGIPETVRSHLFQPVRSAKAQGTGLGLAIAAQLARSLGGDLELLYTGPEGTGFRLQIPTSLKEPPETVSKEGDS